MPTAPQHGCAVRRNAASGDGSPLTPSAVNPNHAIAFIRTCCSGDGAAALVDALVNAQGRTKLGLSLIHAGTNLFDESGYRRGEPVGHALRCPRFGGACEPSH